MVRLEGIVLIIVYFFYGGFFICIMVCLYYGFVFLGLRVLLIVFVCYSKGDEDYFCRVVFRVGRVFML